MKKYATKKYTTEKCTMRLEFTPSLHFNVNISVHVAESRGSQALLWGGYD